MGGSLLTTPATSLVSLTLRNTTHLFSSNKHSMMSATKPVQHLYINIGDYLHNSYVLPCVWTGKYYFKRSRCWYYFKVKTIPDNFFLLMGFFLQETITAAFNYIVLSSRQSTHVHDVWSQTFFALALFTWWFIWDMPGDYILIGG